MSDRITAKMISEELIDAASEGCGMYPGGWDCLDPKEIAAAILNAAIEAGLVSPPVYVIRAAFDNAPLKFGNTIALFSDPSYAEKWQRPEHWKGNNTP